MQLMPDNVLYQALKEKARGHKFSVTVEQQAQRKLK